MSPLIAVRAILRRAEDAAPGDTDAQIAIVKAIADSQFSQSYTGAGAILSGSVGGQSVQFATPVAGATLIELSQWAELALSYLKTGTRPSSSAAAFFPTTSR